MQVRPLSQKLLKYIKDHNLENKFKKQLFRFQCNPRHPSLNTELLEPKHRRIYSFRLDRKYRVIFVITNSEAEIIDINDHYRQIQDWLRK